MNSYIPDNWVVIKFLDDDPHYRVLAGWSSGYTTGSSWRMNSGIVRAEHDEDYIKFVGSSGSSYKCHAETYGLKMNNAHVWTQLQQIHGDKVELIDESNVDWLTMNWIINS